MKTAKKGVHHTGSLNRVICTRTTSPSIPFSILALWGWLPQRKGYSAAPNTPPHLPQTPLSFFLMGMTSIFKSVPLRFLCWFLLSNTISLLDFAPSLLLLMCRQMRKMLVLVGWAWVCQSAFTYFCKQSVADFSSFFSLSSTQSLLLWFRAREKSARGYSRITFCCGNLMNKAPFSLCDPFCFW